VRTLAELVAAALRMPRASLAELGRRLAASTCKTAKHCIKRAWRFTSNERIHIPEAMQGPLSWLFHQRPYWKKHPLVVSMDQTKVRSFPTLMLATVVRGRALPLLWESYEEGKLPKGQNYLEERLLRVLRSLVPSWVRVIVVATVVLDARSWLRRRGIRPCIPRRRNRRQRGRPPELSGYRERWVVQHVGGRWGKITH
jgi:hypothetical protein